MTELGEGNSDQNRLSGALGGGGGRGARQGCSFHQAEGERPEQSGRREKAQTSCPIAGMSKHLGEGRNRAERGK
jgi:hypothetical protein